MRDDLAMGAHIAAEIATDVKTLLGDKYQRGASFDGAGYSLDFSFRRDMGRIREFVLSKVSES